MFCKIRNENQWVVVYPSLLGRLLHRMTFGWIKPSITLNRDFGPGCYDGKCLRIEAGCSVTVNGALKMKNCSSSNIIATGGVNGNPPMTITGKCIGKFHDSNVWKF